MSDAKTPPTKAEVMPFLANGINNALVNAFGTQLEFVLIVALPDPNDQDYVELSTITGITDPGRLTAIAHHINDLARMHREKGDPDITEDIAGHA